MPEGEPQYHQAITEQEARGTLERLQQQFLHDGKDQRLDIDRYVTFLADPNAFVPVKIGGIEYSVPISQIFNLDSSFQESIRQSWEIIHMLFSNGQKVEPKEEMFYTIDSNGQRVPKFSSFRWENFGSHTDWHNIIAHIIATPVASIMTKATVITMRELKNKGL